MTGTVVRIKGIKRYREPKTGRIYCYHRASGARIKEDFGSPEFFVRLAELEQASQELAENLTKPQTLKALILSYKQTDAFRDLAPRTRSYYENIFVFLEPLHQARLATVTTPMLVKLRNKWRETRGRRFVNYVRAVLSVLFSHAIEIGQMDSNPVSNVKQIRRDKNAPAMNRAWTLAERQAALTHLPPHIKLPVAIALYTGLRQGDVLRLPRNATSGGVINVTTRKRMVPISLAVLDDLQQALTDAPPHDAITLCATLRGTPWTESGFRGSFRKEMAKLRARGLIGEGLTFHGLRHTVATVLAEAGVSAEDIASVLGQRSSQMAQHYASQADRSHRSNAAIHKLKPLNKAAEKSRKKEQK